MIKTLDELAHEFHTDKCSCYHNYANIYEHYFEPLRFEPITILEIGVAGGGSMKVWEQYFPNATIYGLDIEERCLQYATDRVKILIGNQADRDFMKKSFGSIEFDIIIDDGGHQSREQLECYAVMFDRLKKGGLYIIEDLSTSFNYQGYGIREHIIDKVCKVMNQVPCEIEEIHFSLELCIIKKRVEAWHPNRLPEAEALSIMLVEEWYHDEGEVK